MEGEEKRCESAVCTYPSQILQLGERPWPVSTASIAVRECSRHGNGGEATPVCVLGARCPPGALRRKGRGPGRSRPGPLLRLGEAVLVLACIWLLSFCENWQRDNVDRRRASTRSREESSTIRVALPPTRRRTGLVRGGNKRRLEAWRRCHSKLAAPWV